MPKITLLSRVHDALPLAASLADDKDAYADELQDYERQAKKIIKNVSREHGGGGLQGSAVTAAARSSSASASATVEVGYFSFHYLAANDVVYLTLTERAYPRKLAFAYLDELRREFETVYTQQQVQSAARPYEMVRFDTFIQKTKRVYLDASTPRNLDKLNSELVGVRDIMTRSINDVLGRGERLEHLQQSSSTLRSESRRYLRSTKRANLILRYRQYGPMAAILLVLGVALWFFKLRR